VIFVFDEFDRAKLYPFAPRVNAEKGLKIVLFSLMGFIHQQAIKNQPLGTGSISNRAILGL